MKPFELEAHSLIRVYPNKVTGTTVETEHGAHFACFYYGGADSKPMRASFRSVEDAVNELDRFDKHVEDCLIEKAQCPIHSEAVSDDIAEALSESHTHKFYIGERVKLDDDEIAIIKGVHIDLSEVTYDIETAHGKCFPIDESGLERLKG